MNIAFLWIILTSKLLFSLAEDGDTIHKSYTVYYHDKEVGYTNISYLQTEEFAKYVIKSETDVHILKKNTVLTQGESYYKAGKYYKGNTLITVNNEPYSKSTTSRSSNDQLRFTYNDEPTTINQAINKTTFWLYMHEPVNVDEIFVEFKGVFKTVEKVSDVDGLRGYKVSSKGSNISHSTYFYSQGELVKIITKEGPVTFTLKLNEE